MRGIAMVAIGKGFVATLSTDMRGPIERKPAATWGQAFAKARLLLDAAEKRDWYRGEVVSVQVAQSDE
jgi:hypothetical protein